MKLDSSIGGRVYIAPEAGQPHPPIFPEALPIADGASMLDYVSLHVLLRGRIINGGYGATEYMEKDELVGRAIGEAQWRRTRRE